MASGKETIAVILWPANPSPSHQLRSIHMETGKADAAENNAACFRRCFIGLF